MPGVGLGCSILGPGRTAWAVTGKASASTPATAHPGTRIIRSPTTIIKIRSWWERPRTPPNPRLGATSRTRLLRFSSHNSFDFDLVFALADLREIVGHLQTQPGF